MFHNIPATILDRMHFLEKLDARDRTDGTPRMKRLRQIPEITGRFIALLAAAAPEGDLIEIGTSAGYSTLWLALACAQRDRRITTFEILAEKAALARQTFKLAQVDHIVTLIEDDARDHLSAQQAIAFCFLDAEKEIYSECYDLVVPGLVPGGFLLADNAINHQATLEPMLNRAQSDGRVDALVVPVGKGVLVCRKL